MRIYDVTLRAGSVNEFRRSERIPHAPPAGLLQSIPSMSSRRGDKGELPLTFRGCRPSNGFFPLPFSGKRFFFFESPAPLID
jgi:hypothetical protein